MDQIKTVQQRLDQLDFLGDDLDAETEEIDEALGMEDMHAAAASNAHDKVAEAKVRCEHLGFVLLMFLALLSFLPLVIYINLNDDSNKKFFEKLADEWLNDDHAARMVFIGHLMFTPFSCPAAVYLLWNVDKVIQQRKPSKVKVFSQGISLAIVSQVRIGVAHCFKKAYLEYIGFYIDFALWLLVLSLWYSWIKDVRARLLGYLRAFDGAITSHAPYKKQLSIMLSFTKFQDKKGKNAIYSFNKPNTACEALELYVLFYYAAFCILPALLFVFWYFGVPISGNFVGVALLGAGGASLAFFTTGIKNLISIVVSKPFYLGDIIEVDGIIGFVENFTWSHIVIRDFGCKQTWITHAEFEGKTVLNWTRRNTKPVLVQLSFNACTSANVVQELVGEATQLVKANEKINQKGYIKVCISSMECGYVLTALFFPAPGQQKKIVREGYLLDVMRVAAAKKIELVPTVITTSFPNGASGLSSV